MDLKHSAMYYVNLLYYLVFTTKLMSFTERDILMLTITTYTLGLPTSINFLVQIDKPNYDLNDALLISLPNSILMRPFLSNGPLKIPRNHSSPGNISPLKP